MNISVEPWSSNSNRSKMTIDLGTGDGPPEILVVRRNDAVVCEIILGVAKAGPELWEEVVRARRLEALPMMITATAKELARDRCIEDHVNRGPKAQREAFFRGLVDGLNLKTVPHPDANCPVPIRPEHSPSYSAGYADGESIARLAIAAQQMRAAEGA